MMITRQSAAETLNNKTGIIYMCTSPSGKKYIGQHNSEDLRERQKTHEYRYFNFLKDKCITELKKRFQPDEKFPDNPTGYCTALYCAFQKYSMSDFKWEVLQNNVPLCELNSVEDKLILSHNTIVPNGYNLKLNKSYGDIKAYSEETRKRMSESSIKKVRDNLHKYRRNHEELKDIPQYVTYFESKGIRGYRIVRHPKCPSKQFADATTPVEDLKKQLLEFLKKCEDTPYVTVQQRKKEKGIPKGMTEQRPGRFLVQFAYKGKRYVKFFSSEPREKALAEATKWMQDKKKELLKQE